MWIKIDDNLPDHPKIVTAGPEAAWLYICGLCFCNRFLTDGRIPERQLRRLVDFPDPRELANRLIDVGLWEQADEGYLVHDYLEHQSSKEEVQEAQKRRADAGRLGGFAKAEAYRKQTSSKPLANARAMSEIISSKSLADKEEDKDKDTEEEKRRGARAKAARSLPDDFVITDGMRLWAKKNVPGLDILKATEEWADAMRSNTTKYKYTDWEAAWHNGMKRAQQWGGNDSNGSKANWKNGPDQQGGPRPLAFPKIARPGNALRRTLEDT